MVGTNPLPSSLGGKLAWHRGPVSECMCVTECVCTCVLSTSVCVCLWQGWGADSPEEAVTTELALLGFTAQAHTIRVPQRPQAEYRKPWAAVAADEPGHAES